MAACRIQSFSNIQFFSRSSPNPAVLSAVYHSVIHLKPHLDMIDAAAAVVLKGNPYLEEWKKLSKKTKDSSKWRNYLAHFGLVAQTDIEGKTKALLKFQHL